MPRISGTTGPSHADLAKEATLLTQQGKVNASGKLNEWLLWKVSLCGIVRSADA